MPTRDMTSPPTELSKPSASAPKVKLAATGSPAIPIHSSIVLRSALLVLLISGMLGWGMLTLITGYIQPTVQAALNKRIGELVKTVENTARIASFLGDTSLAGEVAKGLLANRDVQRVVISNEQGVLVDLDRHSQDASDAATDKGPKTNNTNSTNSTREPLPNPLPEGATVQSLSSPFKPETTVGRIVVLRNEASIKTQVAEAVDFIRLPIILQTTLIIIVVTLIAVGYIAHPIRHISQRLSEISAVDGEKLDIPAGHEPNEIGRLVKDVNALIDKLVHGLITERELRVERELGEKRFRAIFENAETGIFVIDHHGQLKSYNAAFHNTMCLDDLLPHSSNAAEEVSLLNNLGDQTEKVSQLIENCLSQNQTLSEELMVVDSHGSPRWINMILNPFEGDQIQGVINDITESKLREAHANKLALTDALTGLGNRLGFERQIEMLLSEHKLNPERNFTLMLIDLDRFKEVNDTLGHDVGDAVLKQVSRHIEHSIRKSDFAARLGGDEFVILLPFVTDPSVINRLASTLIRNISQPIETSTGLKASVGASIGVALTCRDDAEISKEDLIKQADLALYAVKEAGRNGYRIFGHDPANPTTV
jgi:diguanylate cyclase (GGDEF)-like protein/PAS domain S-box-containing protein